MPGFRSIRLRLTFWYVLLLAVILAAFSSGVYFTLRYNLYANLDDSINTRVDDLLASVQYDGSRPTLAGRLPSDSATLGEQFVRVYSLAGEVTFEDSAPAGDVAVDREVIQEALSGTTRTRAVDARDETFRVRTVPIERQGQIAGALEVGLSQGDVADTLRTLLIILAVAYAATLLVASFGGVFLAGRALSPIDKLTRLARRISAEDLGQRLDLQLPDDEVGRLARTFDEMIGRLDEAFRRQRQFTADASHELRTPLTAMKGQVEVALSKPREKEDYRQVLQAVNEEVDRLVRLVGSLLTLARADAGQIPIAFETVSLRLLVAGALEQVGALASQRGIELRSAPGPDVGLSADEDLLLQLLLNLLDNAIKYTPAGGQISVGWQVQEGQAGVWVRDTGSGISAADLSHVFDRFYRADKARSRAAGGVGLGLSICRWIAQAHGGSISVESTPGQGAAFTVTLPVGIRTTIS